MRTKRAIFLSVAATMLSALLVGCAGSSQPPKPSLPTSTNASKVDGLHTYDVGCGGNKEVVTPSQIQVGTVRGTLRLEQSTDSNECRYAYWGKFHPDLLSKGGFSVTIQADQRTLYLTPSDTATSADNSSFDVFSLVVDATGAHTVKTCVTTGSDETRQCLTAIVS